MANVVKVKEVLLYVGITANAQQCYLIKKFLTDSNVNFTLMNYADDTHHDALFSALNTWSFGRPEALKQHVISDFPFVTWKSYYDDYEQSVNIAFTVEELQENLVPIKDLIQV